MSRSRTEAWLALAVLAIALLVGGILGLWGYMSATARPLHPDPGAVPSVTLRAPSPRWAGAAERARRIVRAGLTEQNLPGVSVAVGVREDLVWAEGFGWADLESRARVSPETRFRIGTASTVLTSAAVGLLLEQNRLKLDEEIRTYVPEFPKKQWPVTLRQVMGHVAGLRSDGGDEGPLFGERCDRPLDALQFFADRPLLFEPGTRRQLSRYGWILVSAAVEAAGGESFLTFMRKHVFQPLGMNDTRAETTDPMSNRATPYFPKFAADNRYGPDPMRELHLSCYAGAGVFLSTPSDLVRFGIGINNGTLLQPATVQLLQRSQRLRSGEETGYGLGWDIETVSLSGQPTRMVGHDGDVLGGRVASLMTFPDRGLVVAVIANTSYADTATLAMTLAEVFAEEWGSSAAR